MGRNRPSPPPELPLPVELRPMGRRDWILLALLTLLAFGMRAWRLDFPVEQYFDEIYYVKAGMDYLDLRADSNTVHPTLGKVQIAVGMLAGDRLDAWTPGDFPDTAEWRLAGLLAGTAMVPITFLLGFRLSRGNTRVAGLAAFLLAADFMHLAVSRIAMLDIFVAFWILVGFYATWRYLEEARRASSARWRYGVFAALAFGVATACKWNGLFGAFGATLAMVLLGNPDTEAPRPDSRESLLRWVVPPLLMALLIPLVYALSYLPVLVHEGWNLQATWEKVKGYHELMWTFRHDPKQFTHRYLSQWWSWPLVIRPIWFYYKADQGVVSGIVALGSIVFWWTSLLYLMEIGVYAVTNRDRACGFLILAYLPQWLLWASSTTGGFIYYLVTAVPFMALAAAVVLEDWLETGGRWLAWAYLAVIAFMLVFYFPFLTGLPTTQRHFDMAFPGWVTQWR